MHVGHGYRAPPFRRCPLIPRVASGIAHRHCSAWSPPFEESQRGLRWAGLESQCTLHRGMELCLWSVLPHVLQQICCPPGPLSQALTASVSPLCSHPPSCPFQQAPTLCSLPLARFIGNPGEPCPGCLDHCLDHDLPLANRSFSFNYQIYLDSIPGFLFWLCQLKQVNLLLCASVPSAVK